VLLALHSFPTRRSSDLMLSLFADRLLVVDRTEHVDFERAVTSRECGCHHVLQHGQVGEDLRRLENAGNAELVDLVRLPAGQDIRSEEHTSELQSRENLV